MSDFHCAIGDWYKRVQFPYAKNRAGESIESGVPNYSVTLHNIRCYNTQNKQLVYLYIPNLTIGVVSLAGHYMAVAS